MRATLLLLLTLLAFFLSACAAVDKSRMRQDDSDPIPWNTRAGWENQAMGSPQ